MSRLLEGQRDQFHGRLKIDIVVMTGKPEVRMRTCSRTGVGSTGVRRQPTSARCCDSGYPYWGYRTTYYGVRRAYWGGWRYRRAYAAYPAPTGVRRAYYHGGVRRASYGASVQRTSIGSARIMARGAGGREHFRGA